MNGIMPVISVLICIFLLFHRGRLKHPGMPGLRGWSYAHRGLHGPGVPENSMAAFRAALEGGYGIELDLHLMKDGNLAVIHDSSLKRTAGADVRVEDLTQEELKNYPLLGTEEIIPTFRQVLDLYRGKAPLIIELKCVDGNFAPLAETACKLLEGYEGSWCMESFDPRVVNWLRKNRPQVIRGQLAEDYAKTGGNAPWALLFALRGNLLNFITQPDFVAYRFDHRNTVGNYICRRVWGMQGVAWTLRTKEAYDTAVKEGWLPIFENFIP